MQYLNIKYNINGLGPEDIVKIEKLLQPYESDYFSKLITKFPLIDISNINVVLSDNIWRDINDFYEGHGHTQHKLRPKGLDHLAKFASVKTDKKLFWSSKYTGDLGVKAFFKVLFENLIGSDLEKKNKINKVFDTNTTVRYITDQFFKIWLSHIIAFKETIKIVPTDSIQYDDMNELTFAFKKNIRDLHYQFQIDLDKYLFITNIFLEFEIFIRRILTYKISNHLIGLEEFQEEVVSIVKSLEGTSYSFNHLDGPLLEKNNKHIQSVLRKCGIDIYDNKELNNIGFKPIISPKKLFIDLIDTHPRIICFIDILGFKALIKEYETKNNSLVLKRLKSVFDATRIAAFEILLNTFQKDIKEQLEFKMFSDCITISIPYIEFGVDIKNGFHSMAIILNVLQQTFMKEGFYLRGHVTLGSYYSDENMLFSGGLVEAYENEGKTIYPAVSINKKIIKKLEEKTEYDESLPPMNTLIIKHKLLPSNNSIINPFFTHDTFNSLDTEIDKMFGETFSGLGKKIKGIFTDTFQSSKMDLEGELANDLKTIKEKLSNNFNHQFSVYENLGNTHKERTIASSVIEKYRFINDLIIWREGGINENFEYLLNE